MADNQLHLDVTVRTAFGKGAARKIRAKNEIPAVLYGHGSEPRHLTLPGHQTMLLLRNANAVIELNIEGEEQLALVKDVQRDPVRQIIEHVDMLNVRRGERVDVDVPVNLIGETVPGTIVVLDSNTLSVSAEATHIPASIDIDVQGLDEGHSIHIRDVVLPEGTSLQDPEADIIILSVQIPQEEPEEDTTADEATAAEPEVVADESAE